MRLVAPQVNEVPGFQNLQALWGIEFDTALNALHRDLTIVLALASRSPSGSTLTTWPDCTCCCAMK